MNHHDMLQLASELVADLRHACTRIEIAGSIRRGKPEPKDIEIVCIPRIEHRPALNLFGESVDVTTLNYLDDALQNLYCNDRWQLDLIVPRNGEKYKRLRHLQTGVCCDLFITTPECWGVIYTIRTGSGEFSKDLVTFAKRKGFAVDGGRLYRENRNNTRDVLKTPEEPDVFAALSLPWIDPPHRTAEALREVTFYR